MASLEETLEERGKRYGSFAEHSAITDALKEAAAANTPHKTKLAPDQKEALDMIFHKIGRILAGDPDWADSWHDIAGYAKLVEDRLNAEQAAEAKKTAARAAAGDPWEPRAPVELQLFDSSNIIEYSHFGKASAASHSEICFCVPPAQERRFPSGAHGRPVELHDRIKVACDPAGRPIKPRTYFVVSVEELDGGCQRICAIPERYWVLRSDFREALRRGASLDLRKELWMLERFGYRRG